MTRNQIRGRPPPRNEAARSSRGGEAGPERFGNSNNRFLTPTGPTGQWHDRTRPNRADRRWRAAEWRRGIRKLLRDGGGACSAEIFRVDSFSDLTRLMLDPRRASLLAGLLSAVARALEPALCLDCDTEFGPKSKSCPAAVLLVLPYRSGSSLGSVSGICQRCTRRDDHDLMDLALRRLKTDLAGPAPDRWWAPAFREPGMTPEECAGPLSKSCLNPPTPCFSCARKRCGAPAECAIRHYQTSLPCPNR
jgi:hypothetical protein